MGKWGQKVGKFPKLFVATIATVCDSHSESNGGQMHYAVKISDSPTIRSFSSSEAARNYGGDYYIFANADDLAASQLTHNELMLVHWLAAGYETNVKDRIYLCDLILDKVTALNLTPTDGQIDQSIVKPEVSPEIEQIVEDLDETKDQEPRFEEPEPEAMHEPPSCMALDERKPKFKLRDPPIVKYSPLESAAFNWLSINHPTPQTIENITMGVWIGQENADEPSTSIRNALKGLQRKLIFNSEPFALKISPKHGTRPMMVSLLKAKRYAPKNPKRNKRSI